jgi:hypothetical protein
MEQMLQNANLSLSACDFFSLVMRECPATFRTREMYWQLKLLSRYSAERSFFGDVLEKKRKELQMMFPILRIESIPPHRSTPLSGWFARSTDWINPFVILTQLFLEQILSSSDVILDFGSRADAFFVSEGRDFISWVPDSSGTRWHEPFRSELARLYLGWAFDQERLMETAIQALHMIPLADEIADVLSHWREAVRCSPENMRRRFLKLFKKAQSLGLHLHPNTMIWAFYELEFVEVFAGVDFLPNLEHSADELCRLRSQIA